MGLMSESVNINWANRNKNRYISKGYHFTKIKESFEVSVFDLSDGCNAKVLVKCDDEDCKNPIKEMPWNAYLRYVKPDGKYYCSYCNSKLYKHKIISTKLKNSISFEQWCIENKREDVLKRWDYDLNNISPNMVCYRSSSRKYYFKCSAERHNSEKKSINLFVINQADIDCKQCNSFAQWGVDNLGEDFLDKYWDYEKNGEVNPWIIASKSDVDIWIKCLNHSYHDSYKTSPVIFNTLDCRCPYCSNRNGKVHKLDSLGSLHPEVIDLWSSKNKESPYSYSPKSKEIVWWKCPEEKHRDYYRKISTSNLCEFRCPECVRERNESFLQEKVRLYLNELGYNMFHERNCNIVANNPKTKSKKYSMPYDNEVVELKLIIEVHGLQHYKITKWHKQIAKKNNTTPEYELHMQQVRDRYKRVYAKSKGYFYLEIPYWTDDEKETWKNLINDKVSEIHQTIE